MINKVIGKQRKQGTYEGRDYDNVYLHCTCKEFLDDGFEGEMCQVVKVKSSDVPSNLTVGAVIDVQYNAQGKVASVTVLCEEGEVVE